MNSVSPSTRTYGVDPASWCRCSRASSRSVPSLSIPHVFDPRCWSLVYSSRASSRAISCRTHFSSQAGEQLSLACYFHVSQRWAPSSVAASPFAVHRRLANGAQGRTGTARRDPREQRLPVRTAGPSHTCRLEAPEYPSAGSSPFTERFNNSHQSRDRRSMKMLSKITVDLFFGVSASTVLLLLIRNT